MDDDDSTRTPGQILRATRETREQSLQDAEEGTKIPLRLLEAIERDEYHKLSGPLYVKSFLRNYAGWLGLGADEILAVYELATGRPEQTVSAEDEVWSEDQVAVTRVGMPWARLVTIAVAATVVLAVLVGLAVSIFGGDDEQPDRPPTTGAAAPVEQQRTVVTRTEPDADEPATRPETDTTPPVVEDSERSRIRPEFQPAERAETRQERLARLTQDRLGGLPDETGTPVRQGDDASPEVNESSAREGDLAPPRRGDPELRFTGGQSFPLVLRVVLTEPANCAVRRDEQADAVPVIWPDNPDPPPAYNLRHGLAYAVRGGFAIYWGAADHFTLTLDRIRDVEVTLNGYPQSLRDWRPGQTKLLDASRLPGGGG